MQGRVGLKGRGGVRAASRQLAIDVLEHARDILIYIDVPVAEHAKALLFEAAIPPAITCSLQVKAVLAAVHFDDEPGPAADEIHDSAVARVLPSEMKAA